MKVREFGSGSLIVGLVGCLHGNETIGSRVIRQICAVPLPQGLRIRAIVANEEAMDGARRFVESDLNRSFPGNAKGTAEERLAHRIRSALADCDFVIDVHSTHSTMEPLIITTSRTRSRTGVSRLIRSMPVRKVAVMGDPIASGRSLIDNVAAGVSLEVKHSTPARVVSGIVMQSMRNLASGSSAVGRKDVFEVFGFIDGDGLEDVRMRNFSIVRKGDRIASRGGMAVTAERSFYPMFLGEEEYSGKLCMAAVRAARSHI